MTHRHTAPPPSSVPLERSHLGLIYVAAELQGQPVRMIVDTGANRTILDTGTAARLGFESHGPPLEVAGCLSSSAGEADVGSLRVGSLYLSGRALVLLDLGPMKPKLGEDVDGILGADLLAATGAEIDYGRGELRMASASAH